MKPELELLLQLGRIPMATTEEPFSFDPAGLDWEAFLDAAVRHGVLSLVHHNLQKGDRLLYSGLGVPPGVHEQMRALVKANAHRSFLMAAESIRLVRLLAKAGIQAFPFKGPALSAVLYEGDPTWRQSSDLDLWVRAEDAMAAKIILDSAGMQCGTHSLPRKESSLVRNYPALRFSSPGPNQLSLELHWSLYWRGFPFRIDYTGIWDRSQPLSLLDHLTMQPSPEDTLLLLSLHGCFHRFERLIWLSDLWALTHIRLINWAILWQRALSYRLERSLAIACLLANRLFTQRWPIYERSLSDSIAHKLAEEMAESFLASPSEATMPIKQGQQADWGQLGYISSLSRSRWDRVRYALSLWLVPNENEWKIIRLPAALDFLYVPLRPLRLLAEYGLRPLRPFLKGHRPIPSFPPDSPKK